MRGLDGRTYIVTGAASGIGRATAARLLEEGARGDGGRRRASPRRRPAVRGPSGRWAFTHTDVTDEDSVAALVRAATEFGGALDGLVNAAGVAGGGPVHMLPADGVGPRHRGQPDRHLPHGQARDRADARPADRAPTGSAARW